MPTDGATENITQDVLILKHISMVCVATQQQKIETNRISQPGAIFATLHVALAKVYDKISVRVAH